MITRIRGLIVDRDQSSLHVETASGLTYCVKCPTQTSEFLKDCTEPVLLFTSFHVGEAAFHLFGFHSASQVKVFDLLTSVNGVGGTTALVLMSSMSEDEIAMAVESGDEKAFTAVKGIGPKTAKQIILDLKGKFSTHEVSTAMIDAKKAVIKMGYSASDVKKIAFELTGDDTQYLIRELLKRLQK